MITPLIGYLVLLIPLNPSELKIGIAVMCCAPTVLASSAILADQVCFFDGLIISVVVVFLWLSYCPYRLISSVFSFVLFRFHYCLIAVVLKLNWTLRVFSLNFF